MRPFGIPSTVWFMVILTAIAAFLMRTTDAGRSIYAVGGNLEAARAAGIDPARVTVGAFAVHGLFAGIAGILFATQLQVIQSTVPPQSRAHHHHRLGDRRRLDPRRHRHGDRLDARRVLFATIGSGLIFLNVSAYWLRAVLALLILATVMADMIRRRRAT